MGVVHATLTRGRTRSRVPAGNRSAAGFSLVEVLVAAVLLLFILLGVVPLFVRASVNRQAGSESTAAASFARSRAEALLQLPFDHADLTIPNGDTELEVVEYRLPGSDAWSDDPSDAGGAVWVRTTRVRQFGAGDLLNGDGDGDGDDLDDPRPGGSDPRSIQLKEIEVAVTSPREAGPLGAAEELTVRVLKAF